MRILGCEGGWFGGDMLVVSGRSEWDLGWSGVNWVGVGSNAHFQKAPVVADLECCQFKGIQSEARAIFGVDKLIVELLFACVCTGV
jgi:hypothetical protein